MRTAPALVLLLAALSAGCTIPQAPEDGGVPGTTEGSSSPTGSSQAIGRVCPKPGVYGPAPTWSPEAKPCPRDDPRAEAVHIYVGDFRHGRIVRFDDMGGGDWITYGSLGTGVGQFNDPNHLTVDGGGRIYVPDQANHRIVRMDDMTGAGWSTYGTAASPSQPSGPGQLWSPVAVRLDPAGRIHIAAQGSGPAVIRIDDMPGTNWTSFGRLGSNPGEIGSPKALAFDGQGRLYIADKCNYQVARVDDVGGANWAALRSTGTGGPALNCGTQYPGRSGDGVGQFAHELNGIAVGPDGKLYIADEHNHRIVRVDDMTGAGWKELRGASGDTFHQPHDIAFSPSGRMYVTDTIENRIIRFDDMDGANWTVFQPLMAGKENRGPAAHLLEAPKGLWVTPRP